MLARTLSATLIWLTAVVAANAQETAFDFVRLPPLESANLEPLYCEDWQNENVSDEKRGVFIEVITRDPYQPSGGVWREILSAVLRGCTSKNTTDKNIQWISNVSISPECTVRVRIRQDADALRYLITTSDAPLFPRYIALREIYEVPLSQEERLALIESSSRDPKAEMRYMAILKTWDFSRRAEVVPICARALTDPSLTVALDACSLLIDVFDVRDQKTGKPLDYGGFYSGAPVLHYERQHSVVLHVAESIHAADPKLVTEEDLAIIRARRFPTEAWWKWMYGKDYKGAQERYLEEKKNGPLVLQTFPLEALDAAATLADLKAQFPGVRLDADMKEARVYVLANRSQLVRIEARIDWLKTKANGK